MPRARVSTLVYGFCTTRFFKISEAKSAISDSSGKGDSDGVERRRREMEKERGAFEFRPQSTLNYPFLAYI